MPAVAEVLLVGVAEGVADARSTNQMRLGGVPGLLDLAASNMRCASSATLASEVAGRRRGAVKIGEVPGSQQILQLGTSCPCLLLLFVSRCYV